ncbi:MAG TPA: hypothetical protein VIJ95_08020, partial [Hanamia sp.]
MTSKTEQTLKKRNASLEKELAAKNRELEIETALEKVRARTMAMQHSDELAETSFVLFQQFKELGKTSDQISIGIFKEGENVMELYSTLHGSQWKEAAKVDLSEPVVMKKIHAAWKKKKHSMVIDIEGDQLKKYNIYREKLSNLKYKEKRWVIQAAFFSKGVITFSATEPHPKETIQLLERFAVVFDGAYTRFLDLQKAEAQAREAQIEAALERVRSRTMAMHQTSELQQVIHTVHKELLSLNLLINGGSFVVINDDVEPALRCWGSGGTADTSEEVYVPDFDMHFVKNLIQGIKNGQGFFTEEFSQKEKKKYFTKLFEHKPWSDLSDEQKNETLSASGSYTRSVAVSKHTSIFIINHKGRKFTEAENDILNRFAKVFEQTYTRFLDLQKAEAQAREARIQLALERVRARTMAMQKSEELKEVIQLILEQFVHLGLETEAAGFMIDYKDSNDINVWVSSPRHPLATQIHIPYFDHPIFKLFVEAKEKGFDFYTVKLTKEEKDTLFTHIFQQLPGFPEEWKQQMYAAPGYADSHVMLNNIALYIQNYTGIPYSDVDNAILMRFAKAFEQTYTRFLDLKKAEAQARESQIELGLERVRARAMAMQTSNELSELVDTVFKELTKLDFEISMCIINIIDENTLSNMVWGANPETGKPPASYFMKFEDYPFHHAMMKGYKERASKYIYVIEGDEKKNYDEYLFNETEFRKMPAEAQSALRAMKRYVASFSFSNFGGLQTVGGEPLSEANLDILARFGKVFDLTYTRFNDLLKAEAQAREAQIELALERVRARTMAMQKSEELKEVIQVVYDQFVHLNINVEHTGFILDYKERDDMFIWLADKHEVPSQVTIPYFDSSHWNSFIDAKATGKNFFPTLLSFEEKNKFYQDLFKLFPVPDEAKGYYFSCPGLAGSTVLLDNISLYIENFEGIPFTNEENDTLMRLGKVFQQTYTRFLDLQKAEAQARESQIQLALERVRARTMAMQNSDELQDAAILLFQQMKALGVQTGSCGFNIWNKDEKAATVWMSSAEGGLQAPFKMPHTESAIYKNVYSAMKNGEGLLMKEVGGKALKKHFDYLSTLPGIGDVIKHLRETGYSFPETMVYHFAFFNNGYLSFHLHEHSTEAPAIFKRFAKVFEQTYTRFLDLQKAEAQAREARIEAALERVRSRTMGMQHSNELAEGASLLFKQVSDFGINVWSSGFNIWQPDGVSCTINMCNPDGSIAAPYPLPHTEYIFFQKIYEAKQKGEDFLVLETGGKELEETYQYMFSLPAVKKMLTGMEDTGSQIPKFQVNHCAFFSQGYLMFITYEPCPEMWDIFKRFAKVFEQTYTRFLDLQKSEAQAREARIEAALEKVRSRSLAMHKSDELQVVVNEVFERLRSLDIDMNVASIFIFKQSSKDWEQWVASSDTDYSTHFHLPYTDNEIFRELEDAKKSGKDFYAAQYSFAQKNEWFNYAFDNTEYSRIPDERKKFLLESEFFKISFALAKKTGLQIAKYSGENFSEKDNDALRRFSKVFEQAYMRFLDLQKAEAQAREAKIEAALERVRARTMAMYKSENLSAVAEVVFHELEKLELGLLRCGIGIINKEKRSADAWITSVTDEGKTVQVSGTESMDLHPLLQGVYNAWLTNSDFSYLLEGEDLVQYYKTSGTGKVRLPDSQLILSAEKITTQYYHIAVFEAGGLFAFSANDFPEEAKMVMKRFADVFNQSYTRFLDLQKAEAQTREAKIEAALERVRSKTMAMHNSREVGETVVTLFDELIKLGLDELDRCGIGIMHGDYIMEAWTASKTNDAKADLVIGHISMKQHLLLQGTYEAWKEKKDSFQYILEDDDKINYFNIINNQPDYRARRDIASLPPKVVLTDFYFREGCLYAFSDKELSTEISKIFTRFAGVFGQTYRRYLDLQKAEAQARESEIQLALERVRARTMAMQKQDDLLVVLDLLVQQLVKLGVNLQVANFSNGLPGGDWDLWIEVVADANNIFNNYVHFPRIDHPYFHHVEKNIETYRKDGTDLFKDVFSKEVKDSWQDYINTQTIYKDLASEEVRQLMYEKPGYNWSMVILKETWVSICRYDTIPFSDEEDALLRRFANAFGQTYTRFLDLQKAEAQVREAQIESALERVRSRTMAMQNSDELADLVATVFNELNRLEFALTSCIIWINNPELLTAEMWVASTEMNKPPEPYYIKPFRHPYFKSVLDAWKQKNKKWVYEMNVEEKKNFQLQFFNEVGNFPTLMKNALKAPESVVYSASFYNFGALEIIGTEPVTDEKFEILHRLGKVFDMSYTRFNDLKQAEAQAQEAKIEAALERVRSRTMAMQKSDELAETSAILFRQLIHLGIAPNRLYIGVTNDKNTDIEFWITDEEGSKVSTMFSGDAAKNNSVMKMYEGWKQQKTSIVIDMHGKELDEYFHYLGDELRVPFQGGLSQKRRIQYISYFSKGFIGMASPD